MNVVYLEDVTDYKPIDIGDVSVYINDNFVFIGPLRKNNEFCFGCFIYRVKELKLDTHYFNQGKTIELDMFEQSIVDKYINDIKEMDNSVLYIFNRNTKEVDQVSTFKRGDCTSCLDDETIYRKLRIPNLKFNRYNPRQASWRNVVEKLDSNKALAYKNRFSIINRISRSADSYGIPMVETEVNYKDISMLSYGRTELYETTKYTSMLEALERYATAFPYRKSKYYYSENQCSDIDLTISEIIKLNNNSFSDYDKNKKVYYTEVEAIHCSNKKTLIPEQLIYFNSHAFSNEERYIYESSNGSAIGSTEDEASLYAMLELFERDSFLATWYGQIQPDKINLDSIKSEKIKNYIIALNKEGIKAHIFDISLELRIPIVWVLLEKTNPKEQDMAFYTAAGASFVLEDAIERALIEAITAISVFTNVFKDEEHQKRKRMLMKDPMNVNRLEDHLLLYSNKESREMLKFALETPYEVNYEDLEESFIEFDGNYEDVINHFHSILLMNSNKAFRAKTENINLNNLGFVNVKYIVPEMLTMTFGHQNRRVVKSRITKAIEFKGRGYFDEEWIRKTPHPFP